MRQFARTLIAFTIGLFVIGFAFHELAHWALKRAIKNSESTMAEFESSPPIEGFNFDPEDLRAITDPQIERFDTSSDEALPNS